MQDVGDLLGKLPSQDLVHFVAELQPILQHHNQPATSTVLSLFKKLPHDELSQLLRVIVALLSKPCGSTFPIQ